MRLLRNTSRVGLKQAEDVERNPGEIAAAHSQNQVTQGERFTMRILTAEGSDCRERPEPLSQGPGGHAARPHLDAPQTDRNGEIPLTLFTAHELFRGIARVEVEKIASLSYERHYHRDATIYVEGDPHTAIYIVMSGLVKVVSFSETGAETILHMLAPGEVFGELLFGREARPFTAIAIEDTAVRVVPRTHMIELLHSSPSLALNLLTLVSTRLIQAQQRWAQSSHTWSYHRLAKTLLQLAEKYGAESPVGIVIQLPLTHETLANWIGTTRETVTTQLGGFKRMGLVSQQGRRFVVARAALAAFIDSALFGSNGFRQRVVHDNDSVRAPRDTSVMARSSSIVRKSKGYAPRQTIRDTRSQNQPTARRVAGMDSLPR